MVFFEILAFVPSSVFCVWTAAGPCLGELSLNTALSCPIHSICVNNLLRGLLKYDSITSVLACSLSVYWLLDVQRQWYAVTTVVLCGHIFLNMTSLFYVPFCASRMVMIFFQWLRAVVAIQGVYAMVLPAVCFVIFIVLQGEQNSFEWIPNFLLVNCHIVTYLVWTSHHWYVKFLCVFWG